MGQSGGGSSSGGIPLEQSVVQQSRDQSGESWGDYFQDLRGKSSRELEESITLSRSQVFSRRSDGDLNIGPTFEPIAGPQAFGQSLESLRPPRLSLGPADIIGPPHPRGLAEMEAAHEGRGAPVIGASTLGEAAMARLFAPATTEAGAGAAGLGAGVFGSVGGVAGGIAGGVAAGLVNATVGAILGGGAAGAPGDLPSGLGSILHPFDLAASLTSPGTARHGTAKQVADAAQVENLQNQTPWGQISSAARGRWNQFEHNLEHPFGLFEVAPGGPADRFMNWLFPPKQGHN